MPQRALALLAALFAVVLTVLTLVPTIVVDALATASAIFILMYLMCIISYLRVRGITLRSGPNAVLLVVMAVSLVQSGWRSVYGVVVLVVALAVQIGVQRRSRSETPPGPDPTGTAAAARN